MSVIDKLKEIASIDYDEIRIRKRNEVHEDMGYAAAYGELSSRVRHAKEIAILAIRMIESIMDKLDF